MSNKKKPKKKGIFTTCFSCFSSTPIDCDEFTCPGFGYDASDMEYVVENTFIRKAPKKLTNERKERDFSGYVVKKVPPEIEIGPVSKVEDVVESPRHVKCPCPNSQKNQGPSQVAAPISRICDDNYPYFKRPSVAKAYRAETKHHLDEETMNKLLMPLPALYQDSKSQKKKVLVDVHKPNVEEDLSKHVQVIPPDIKEAIDALKIARPLHISSKFSPINRRSFIRSSSNTSCEKDTLCNISDDKEVRQEKQQKTSKAKRWVVPPIKVDASSSTADFTENTDRNVSSDIPSSVKADPTVVSQNQSIKWKIIINKHKEDKKC